MALLDAFNHALAVASETNDVTVKAQIVQDARALSAMAAAYRVSEETQRKVSEASIRLQRSFGASLMATYPGASGAEMESKTGVAGINCIRGVRLAKYTEEALQQAFDLMRDQRKPVGIERTLKELLEADPEYRVRRRLREARVAERNAEYYDQNRNDPDYALAMQVWSKVGSWWMACKEIVRLSREVIRLKAELAKYQGGES